MNIMLPTLSILVPSVVLVAGSNISTTVPNTLTPNSFTPGNIGTTTTKWHPVALTTNSLTNYYFKQGETTQFHGTVYNYDYNKPHQVFISVEIFNKDRQRISREVTHKVVLAPFEHTKVESISPRSLTPGQYYYSIGVYDAESFNLLGWYPGYQHFTVAP